MIFVSAGTQFPFDRLIEMADRLSQETGAEVVAQAIPGKYKPKNFELLGIIPNEEYARLLAKCDMVLAHAGMGVIISAMRENKPIVVLPRLASLGEHRNEHQTSTATHLRQMGYVTVIDGYDRLKDYAANPAGAVSHSLDAAPPAELIDFIRAQIEAAALHAH